jgi:hypothetical protein
VSRDRVLSCSPSEVHNKTSFAVKRFHFLASQNLPHPYYTHKAAASSTSDYATLPGVLSGDADATFSLAIGSSSSSRGIEAHCT